MRAGAKLSEDDLADLEKWIDMGAPDPRKGAAAANPYKVDYEKASQRWAFQVPTKHAPPAVRTAFESIKSGTLLRTSARNELHDPFIIGTPR
jgi:hypothetical protein